MSDILRIIICFAIIRQKEIPPRDRRSTSKKCQDSILSLPLFIGTILIQSRLLLLHTSLLDPRAKIFVMQSFGFVYHFRQRIKVRKSMHFFIH